MRSNASIILLSGSNILEGSYYIQPSCFHSHYSLMKIKIFFNPQALKNIKPTLEMVYKLLQTQEPLPRVFFIYIIKTKNIRFLIDSDKNPIVISLGTQMLNSETSCTLKQDKEMVSILFENSKNFFENLINVLDRDDQFGLYFQVKKEVLDGKECKFVKLTLKNNEKFISRIPVETPKYDISQIKFHPWLCGCLQSQKQVEFVIYLDELLNMMRYMIKLKPPVGTKLCIDFDMTTKVYTSYSSDPQCLPNTQGEIKVSLNCSGQEVFRYEIAISELKVVHQMIRKSKELKGIIMTEGRMVFLHMKEELFVCHVGMWNWVRHGNGGQNRDGGMKIEAEEDEEEEGLRARWD